MKRKEFLKWLKKEADKLPPETYSAVHKLNGTILMEAGEDEEIEESETVKTEVNGKEVRLKKVNVFSQDHLVNHFNRLKRGFDKHGFKFVDKYFRERGFITETEKNKQNGESVENSTTKVHS